MRGDESAAMRGARWVTGALLMVGMLNYGYSLSLTRLLDVAAYSRFAAGQGLILWASTVAIVSVPWVLAQAMTRARSEAERDAAIRFARLAGAGSGLVAAAIVGVIGAQVAGTSSALVLALGTFVIFLGTTTTGWLQGQQRLRALSALYVAENVVKNLAGLLLVVVAGQGGPGALAAFGIGGLVLLAWWPRVPRGAGRPWLGALANRDLWRRALGIAGLQGLVSLLAAIDVVLVAVLPDSRAMMASYQASAAVSRVPLFVAGAVGTAFFPALSRRATGGLLAARAVRMYAAVALPLAAVLATMPAAVLTAVFPAQYGAMAVLLKFTAVAGLAAGGVGLVTAFFQAADDYSCLPWLAGAVAGYVVVLLAGWRIGGIAGLAAGAAVGAAAVLALLGYRLARREGRGLLTRIPVAEPVAAAGMLVLVRPYPLVWLAAATLIGIRAGLRFLRPGSLHLPGRHRATRHRITAGGGPAISWPAAAGLSGPDRGHALAAVGTGGNGSSSPVAADYWRQLERGTVKTR
jgi:O-antigen/teichoic acid export membrane protein